MKTLAVLFGSLLVVATAAGGPRRWISAHGIYVFVPRGWQRVDPQQAVADPQTLVVVGTAGVRGNATSVCQVAAYRIPARGAVVVILGWKSLALAGAGRPTGLAPLRRLVRVSRPSFECFSGRGAAASVVLGRRAFQINVMVGDRASPRRVAEGLAVARSEERRVGKECRL